MTVAKDFPRARVQDITLNSDLQNSIKDGTNGCVVVEKVVSGSSIGAPDILMAKLAFVVSAYPTV